MPVERIGGDRRKRPLLSVDSFLDRLVSAPFIDDDLKDAMHDQREALLPIVVQAAETGRPATRINANALLVYIGDPRGTPGLLKYVTPRNELLCREALLRLDNVLLTAHVEGQQSAMDRPAVFAAIDPLLDRLGRQTRLSALHVLERLDLPEAKERIASLVTDADPEIACSVVRWLAWRGEDRGALKAIARLLDAGGLHELQAHTLTDALKHLAKSQDEHIRRAAGALAVRHCLAHLQDRDNYTANRIWHCIDAMAAAAPAEELPVLRQIVGSSIEPWVRVMALQRLAAMKQPDAIDLMCAALADGGMRRHAAEALSEYARGSTDAMVLASLVAALDQVRDEDETAAVVTALTALGDVPDAILERALKSTSPESAMDILWITKKRRPRQLAKRLVELGIIPKPSAEELQKYEQQWKTHRGAQGILFDLLGHAGRITGFGIKGQGDLEEHTRLLGYLIEITRGALTPEDFTVTADTEEGFSVAFRRGEQVHRFVDRYMGRYFDLRSAIAGVNAVLAMLGECQRLVPLIAGEAAAIAFLPPAFETVRREFFVPADEDPDEGIRDSAAYTNQVLGLD